jgi:thymidine kinase
LTKDLFADPNNPNQTKNLIPPDSVVAIDEIQWYTFPILFNFVSFGRLLGITFVLSGLLADKDQKLFTTTAEMLVHANETITRQAICKICKCDNAIYSKYVGLPPTNPNQEYHGTFFKVAGDKEYQARCSACLKIIC